MLEWFTTGSRLLDRVNGRGWPQYKLINIQGDSATGKTYLAEKAAASHIAKYPKGNVWYLDAESRFDEEYARLLGIPVDDIEFQQDISTVEDWFESLLEIVKDRDSDSQPGLVILDSLDALSDDAEMERGISDPSYGGAKAKKLSELCRRINAQLTQTKITTIVVSQLRDVLNSRFPMKSRSGGKAVEFYSSLAVRMSVVDKIEQTIKGITRVIGTEVKIKNLKSSVSIPFAECDVNMLFRHGIDDLSSCLAWLASTKNFKGLERLMIDGVPVFAAPEPEKKAPKKKIITVADAEKEQKKQKKNAKLGTFLKKVASWSPADQAKLYAQVIQLTDEVWDEIEDAFMSTNASDGSEAETEAEATE